MREEWGGLCVLALPAQRHVMWAGQWVIPVVYITIITDIIWVFVWDSPDTRNGLFDLFRFNWVYLL